MKKLLASLLTLILLIPAQAQNEEKKFNLGVMAIPSIAWAKPDTKNLLTGAGVKPVISLGLSGDFNFSKNYSFTVELFHTNTGFKVKADSLYSNGAKHGNVVIDYDIRSFQIPLSLKLRTNEIGYLKYYAQVGIAPGFGYKSVKANYDPTSIFSNPDNGVDRAANESDDDFNYGSNVTTENQRYYLTSDNVRVISLPIFLGAGMEYNISGNTSLIGGIRYEYGIMNIMKGASTTAQRSSFGLVLGVKF